MSLMIKKNIKLHTFINKMLQRSYMGN